MNSLSNHHNVLNLQKHQKNLHHEKDLIAYLIYTFS